VLSELQTRKLTHLFKLQDLDGDGHLSQADYYQLANRLAELLGYQPRTGNFDALHAAYHSLWVRLQALADHDNDQRVELTEFLEAYEKMLAAPGDMLAVSVAESIIHLTDHDGDHKISQDEFVTYLRGYGVSEAGGQEAFSHLDRDGDGMVDREELLNDVRQFFYSDDPAAPGNWLVGPLPES
jgi:Ca2+-binding EF-hand superfamily protein